MYSYEPVRKPYATVRDMLAERPALLFGAGAADLSPTTVETELEAHVLSARVVRSIRAEFGKFWETDPPVCYRELTWSSLAAPQLHPEMTGEIEVAELGPHHVQLSFIGHYEPPLGVVGGMGDAMGMHRIAKESVDNLVFEIAQAIARTDTDSADTDSARDKASSEPTTPRQA